MMPSGTMYDCFPPNLTVKLSMTVPTNVPIEVQD